MGGLLFSAMPESPVDSRCYAICCDVIVEVMSIVQISAVHVRQKTAWEGGSECRVLCWFVFYFRCRDPAFFCSLLSAVGGSCYFA